MIFVARPAFCQKAALYSQFFAASKQLNGTKNKVRELAWPFFSKQKQNNQIGLRYLLEGSTVGTKPCTNVAADFYMQNFGFTCKKELQLEKLTKIPFRFRIGSLQYNDYLEQKPNAIKPN